MEQSHVIHDLLIIFILVLAVAIFFKRKLLDFSKFQVVCLIILGLFILVHENPGKLLFAYHHQSTDSHQQKHTCCMPLLSESVSFIEIADSTIFVLYVTVLEDQYDLSLLISSIKNKSPPVS